MSRLRHQRHEVPEVVVRGLGLREAAVRRLLGRVNHVRELDRVLDEEDRNVVPNHVPVAGAGVELDGEAAHVTGQVGGALVPGHGGEPDERRRAQARLVEQVGPGEVGQRLVVLEVPVAPYPRACTTRSGIRSWSKWKIFSRKWKSSSADGPRSPARRCSGRRKRPCPAGWSAAGHCRSRLVRLAAVTALDPLVAVLHRLAAALVAAGCHRPSWMPLGTGRRRSGSRPVRCPLYLRRPGTSGPEIYRFLAGGVVAMTPAEGKSHAHGRWTDRLRRCDLRPHRRAVPRAQGRPRLPVPRPPVRRWRPPRSLAQPRVGSRPPSASPSGASGASHGLAAGPARKCPTRRFQAARVTQRVTSSRYGQYCP